MYKVQLSREECVLPAATKTADERCMQGVNCHKQHLQVQKFHQRVHSVEFFHVSFWFRTLPFQQLRTQTPEWECLVVGRDPCHPANSPLSLRKNIFLQKGKDKWNVVPSCSPGLLVLSWIFMRVSLHAEMHFPKDEKKRLACQTRSIQGTPFLLHPGWQGGVSFSSPI